MENVLGVGKLVSMGIVSLGESVGCGDLEGWFVRGTDA